MSCLQNLCSWILVIGLCSGQITVDVSPPEPPEDVTELIQTVSADDIGVPMECGGEYTQDTGRISSPGYPFKNYSFNSNCTWSIKVDEGKVLVMNFEYMDIEIGPPDCPYDGVIVVDDSGLDPIPFTPGEKPFDASWPHPIPQVLGKFCGNEIFKPFVSVTNSVRVGFYSDSDRERSGFVLTWKTADAKPTAHQSCDFEEGFCKGWQNVKKGDKFDWTILSGGTPSSGTGPHFDHTKQNADGKYAYIESSNPRVENDIALLVSPETTFRDDDSDYCLDFWYHMHGSKMGTLGVGLLVGNTQERKWVKSGNQGNQWNHESITIDKIDSPFKVIFVGIVGKNHEGDIAIDDIKLYGKPCSEISWKDRMPLLDEEIGAYTEPCIGEDEFHCKNASTCISKQKLCDGIIDCPEMDDEDSDACKNTTFIPPPIDATNDPLLEETTEGNIFDDSTVDDSTSYLDTTPDFAGITITDSEKLDEETTEVQPRETTRFSISTVSPVDTTFDAETESTESSLEDTTVVVLPRETTNFATTSTTIASNPSTMDSDVTTIEEDFTTTADIDTTDEGTSSIVIDSDQVTTMSTTASTDAGVNFETTVSDWTTTDISKTNIIVEERKEPVKFNTTPLLTQPMMGDYVTTRSRVQSASETSGRVTEGLISTTRFTGDESTTVPNPTHNVELTRESDTLTTMAETHKVPQDFTTTTTMVLLNKLEVSTMSSFVTPPRKTTTLKDVPATLNTETSRPKLSHSSTAKTSKDTTQSHLSTTSILPKNIETTTRAHAVGNMEVATMADKQKGGDSGSSVTSPISLSVMGIAMIFSLVNTV